MLDQTCLITSSKTTEDLPHIPAFAHWAILCPVCG